MRRRGVRLAEEIFETSGLDVRVASVGIQIRPDYLPVVRKGWDCGVRVGSRCGGVHRGLTASRGLVSTMGGRYRSCLGYAMQYSWKSR